MAAAGTTPQTTGSSCDAAAQQPLRHASEPNMAAYCARLTKAIERAMKQKRPLRAERLVKAADRVAYLCAALTERVVCWRLSQSRPEESLRLIEYCREGSAGLAYLRALCLLQLGRTVEAHMQVRNLLRAHPAHQPAQTLSGMLSLEAGDATVAAAELAPAAAENDRLALQLLAIAQCLRGRRVSAADAGRTLMRNHSVTTRTRRINESLLHSLSIPDGVSISQMASTVDAAKLADELAEAEALIPVIAAAARLKRDEALMPPLRDAVALALPRLLNPAAGYTAIIELSLALGEGDTALRWVQQALAQQFGSAAMVLLYERCMEAAAVGGSHASPVIGSIQPHTPPAQGKAA